MNSVNLIGRLTRDPEVRHTPSGAMVCSFTLAVDRAGDKQDDGTYAAGFFDCDAWERKAELISQYVGKGRQLGVTGALRLHKWEAQDGSKRSKVEIRVLDITFIGNREDGGSGGGSSYTPPAEEADFQGSDEDIPF